MINTPETINIEIIIPEECKGQRLDQALAKLLPDYSRARLQEWIKAKNITVNDSYWRNRDKVAGGETIKINAQLAAELSFVAQAIALDILYEDESLLVINKPPGLVVHPAVGNWENTLLNALLHYHPFLENLPRAGIVHRLDKDTSGIMVIAKTLSSQTYLVNQLQQRKISREYEAIVTGVMTAGGTIDAPIGRHSTQRTKMAVNESGKAAVTHYRIIEKYRAHTHIKVLLETGRTHQIRVHMAHIHYPIVGDRTYAGRLQLPKGASVELISALRSFDRQALHAKRLSLIHPQTHSEMSWTAALPDDMSQLIAVLKQDSKGKKTNEYHHHP